MLHVWLETNCAQVPMKFIKRFGSHRSLAKISEMKIKGVAKNVITKAIVNIGSINKFIKSVKNETPSKFDKRIGKIKNCDEIVVASGTAIHFGSVNFFIGVRKKRYTLFPKIIIPITQPKLN